MTRVSRTSSLVTMSDFVIQSTNRLPMAFSSFEPISLNFTYVCQRWRSVALGTPQLWRRLPFVYRKWTEVMLERSKRSTLVIKMNFYNFNSSKVSKTADLQRIKDVVTNHADRIREIELRGIKSSELATLLDGIPDSSLRLTSLVLTRSTPENFMIPTSIMADLHRLRWLHTRGFHFPWYSQSLCALTHLIVEHSPEPPPIASFFAALRAMPALEVLYLEHSLPETCDIRDVDPIILCNLKDLRLISLTCLSSVLSVIIVPAGTTVHLECTEPGSRFPS